MRNVISGLVQWTLQRPATWLGTVLAVIAVGLVEWAVVVVWMRWAGGR